MRVTIFGYGDAAEHALAYDLATTVGCMHAYQRLHYPLSSGPESNKRTILGNGAF